MESVFSEDAYVDGFLRVLREPRSVRDYVYLLLSLVPVGYTISYTALGELVGKHPRAIGVYMKNNQYPILVPCHRVVSRSGLGGFSLGGIEFKKKLLVFEKALDGGKLARVIDSAREFWSILDEQGVLVAEEFQEEL